MKVAAKKSGFDTKQKIVFDSVLGAGGGEICLSIRPPGTWFDSPHFVVFVGGSGVGRTDTLEDAKVLLLERIDADLRRRIDDSRRVTAHYEEQLARLELRNERLEDDA